ncbi:hypothetical protein ACLOJK_033182 [Asimina triloba]
MESSACSQALLGDAAGRRCVPLSTLETTMVCKSPSSLSILWHIPQYTLIGASEVVMYVGQLEFFNGQAPDRLKSFGSALCMTSISLGNYVSSLLATIVMDITIKGGCPGWIPGNLNIGNMDRFYFLLAALTTVVFVVYMACAKWYRWIGKSGCCKPLSSCVRLKEGILDMTFEKDDILPLDVKATWAAMEEIHKMGLQLHLQEPSDLLAHAKIPPAVNQVEMHRVWQQKKLRDFCAEKGVHVSAYSPLEAKEWGFDVVLGNALINDIARAKGKGVGQIALKWGLQQGVSLIPKSFNKGRLSQNFAILDW